VSEILFVIAPDVGGEWNRWLQQCKLASPFIKVLGGLPQAKVLILSTIRYVHLSSIVATKIVIACLSAL
jgi:hypothetical protein